MLNALREGSKKSLVLKVIVFGFLLMGLGGLVLMDVGGVFRGGLGNTTVARVGDTKINIYDFQRQVDRTLRSQGMTTEDARRMGFIDMILQGQIMQELMKQSANDLGFQINMEQVERTIGRMLDSYRQDGQSRKDILDALLMSQSLTEDILIDQTKAQLKTALLKNMLASSALLIPDVTAKAFSTFQTEMRDVDVLFLSENQIKIDESAATPEALAEVYEQNKSQFLIPESRDVAFIKLSSDLFSSQVSVTEDDLKDIYEERIEEYAQPEQRFLEQAIVSDIDVASDILNQALRGNSLDSAVQNITGSKSAYRAETNFDKEGLLEALSDSVFEATELGYLELQQSALGWHVINLTKIEEPRTQSYDEVKDDIRRETRQEMTDDMLIDLLERAEDRISSGDTITQIAEALSLEVQTLDDISNDIDSASQSLMMAGIFDAEAVMPTIFDLDQNTVSDPVELGDDGFLLLEIKAIKTESFQPQENLTDELFEIWIAEQRAEELRKKASATVLFLNTAQNPDLDALARENDTRLISYKNMTRDHSIDGNISQDLVRAIFATPDIGRTALLQGEQGGQIGYYVFRTTKASYADDAVIDEVALASQKLQILQPTDSITQELFYTYLHRRENVSINDDLLDVVFGSNETSIQ